MGLGAHQDFPGAQRGPGGLGPAVPRLGGRGAVAGGGRAGRPFRVNVIVFAGSPAALVALRPENLHDVEPGVGQVRSQAGAERACLLDADDQAASRLPDGIGQVAVPVGRGGERPLANLSPQGVDDA